MSKKGKTKNEKASLQPLPGVGSGSVFNPIPKTGRGKDAKQKERYRSGGHLIDNILKNNQPKPSQLKLFDAISPETKTQIEDANLSIDYINRKGEGIKLSKGEYRLILCLSQILHKKSQTKIQDQEDFYTGNHEAKIVPIETQKGAVRLLSPTLGVTLYEITKEYYGGDKIGGENVKTVSKLLYELVDNPEKKALIKYTREEKTGKDSTREHFVEHFSSLVTIATAGHRNKLRGKEMDEKKEFIIRLHPVFREQINTKYIDLPLDLTQRMIEAHGSPNVPESTTKLVLYLARAYSARKTAKKDGEGNSFTEIGLNKLRWTIAENYMNPKTGKAKRPKLIEEYTKKAIDTAKALGLLLKHELIPGATGELKYVFTLPKNWE